MGVRVVRRPVTEIRWAGASEIARRHACGRLEAVYSRVVGALLTSKLPVIGAGAFGFLDRPHDVTDSARIQHDAVILGSVKGAKNDSENNWPGACSRHPAFRPGTLHVGVRKVQRGPVTVGI